MNRGKYIVIEGAEGVGKTTQINIIAGHLRAAGLAVRVLREPDSQSDLTARAIRRLTQDPQFPLNTRTEVLLYNAARAQSLESVRNSINHGVICLVDRNYLTTLAIQYYGRGDVPDYEAINQIIHFAVGDMEPDLTIVLDASAELLKSRTATRYHGERFDDLDLEFLKRVRAGYLWEAQQRGLNVVNAERSQEEITKDIWELVVVTLANKDTTKYVTTQPVASANSAVVQKSSHQQQLVDKARDGSITVPAAGEIALLPAVDIQPYDRYGFPYEDDAEHR